MEKMEHETAINEQEEQFDVQKRLLEVLQERHIETNHELAVLCHVDDATVSRWLRRNKAIYNFKTVLRICKGLGMKMDDFVSGSHGERRMEGLNSRLRSFWDSMDDTEKFCFYYYGVNFIRSLRRLNNEPLLVESISKKTDGTAGAKGNRTNK